MPPRLTESDIAGAAAALGCDVPAIKAVLAVESRGNGFDPATGKPIILFEPHWFSRLTGGKFDASHPNISYPKWGAKPYPRTQPFRWAQVEAAAALDRAAALSATSWGLFQVMGFNHAICGWPDVESFVAAMALGEQAHLRAFVGYVQAKGLASALAAHDWPAFAAGYNGPGQVGVYAPRLAQAWKAAGGR